MQATVTTQETNGQVRAEARRSDGLVAELAFFSLIFIAACVMFFAQLGEFPFFNPDESLYAEPAREMLVTGEYVTTLLNYVVRYTKPPLCIWAMAGSYKLFGMNEFAARFPGALCGALLVAGLYVFVRKYATRRAALIAAVSLITAPLFVGTAREAITDMPLSLFIGGAVAGLYHAYNAKAAGWRWCAYVFIGLAVMTKGPVGLILPVAILGAFHYLRGDVVEALKYYKPQIGLPLVAAIAVPWFAIEIYITKGAYFNEFIVRENFQRFTSVVDHKQPWWYHIAAVAGGYVPWTLFVPQALIAALRLPEGFNLAHSAKRLLYGCYGSVSPRAALNLFAALWFVVTLVFFSVSVSKLLPYTVPAFAALAIVVAIHLDDAIENKRFRALAVPFVALAIVFVGGSAAVQFAVTKLREAPLNLIQIGTQGLYVLSAVSAVSAAIAFTKRLKLAATTFAVGMFVSMLVIGMQALVIVSDHWEGAVPTFSYFAGQSKLPIIVWHMRKPSITFYAQRRVEIPMSKQELQARLAETNGAYIIGKKADLELLQSLPRTKVIANQGLFVLLAQSAKN